MDPKTYKFDTLSLHAGYMPSKNAGSRQVPIYQTTSYMFEDQNGIFIGHGVSLCTRDEVAVFSKGIAIKVRDGIGE